MLTVDDDEARGTGE
jgi:hypothetical protein